LLYFSSFGMFYQEKSGNPVPKRHHWFTGDKRGQQKSCLSEDCMRIYLSDSFGANSTSMSYNIKVVETCSTAKYLVCFRTKKTFCKIKHSIRLTSTLAIAVKINDRHMGSNPWGLQVACAKSPGCLSLNLFFNNQVVTS
jgi:hypothetical protein